MTELLQEVTTAELDHVVEWSHLLKVLARDAEQLKEPPAGACPLDYRKRWEAVADRWFSLLWPSVTPVFIAQSCRAALDELQPVPVVLREGSPDGFQLVADDRYDYLLKLEAKEQELQRQRDAVAAGERSKPGPRGRPRKVVEQTPEQTPETDHDQQVAARRAEYAAKVAAEREAEAQAEAERRAKVLEIAAAAAAAPAPEPEAEAQEPADDGRVWVPAPELAEALGIARATVDKWRKEGLFDGLWRLPAPDRVRGALFDLEGCRAAVAAHKEAIKRVALTPEQQRARQRMYQQRRRERLREQQQGDTPAAMPVTIEPDEAQGPPVEPSTPADPAPDAAALLARLTSDPATLEALKALLTGT